MIVLQSMLVLLSLLFLESPLILEVICLCKMIKTWKEQNAPILLGMDFRKLPTGRKTQWLLQAVNRWLQFNEHGYTLMDSDYKKYTG